MFSNISVNGTSPKNSMKLQVSKFNILNVYYIDTIGWTDSAY